MYDAGNLLATVMAFVTFYALITVTHFDYAIFCMRWSQSFGEASVRIDAPFTIKVDFSYLPQPAKCKCHLGLSYLVISGWCCCDFFFSVSCQLKKNMTWMASEIVHAAECKIRVTQSQACEPYTAIILIVFFLVGFFLSRNKENSFYWKLRVEWMLNIIFFSSQIYIHAIPISIVVFKQYLIADRFTRWNDITITLILHTIHVILTNRVFFFSSFVWRWCRSQHLINYHN